MANAIQIISFVSKSVQKAWFARRMCANLAQTNLAALHLNVINVP